MPLEGGPRTGEQPEDSAAHLARLEGDINAQRLVIAVLVDRLGGEVTLTNEELAGHTGLFVGQAPGALVIRVQKS